MTMRSFVFTALVLLTPAAGFAQPPTEPEPTATPPAQLGFVRSALLFEGLFAMNAGIVTALGPRDGGNLCFLVAPYALVNTGSTRSGVLAALFFAGLGAYNRAIADNGLSPRAVFGRNFVVWNAALGPFAIAELIRDQKGRVQRASTESGLSLSVGVAEPGFFVRYTF